MKSVLLSLQVWDEEKSLYIKSVNQSVVLFVTTPLHLVIFGTKYSASIVVLNKYNILKRIV